jgi:hypothetical protein
VKILFLVIVLLIGDCVDDGLLGCDGHHEDMVCVCYVKGGMT